MKKTRVLGVALTLAATMAVGGAMGQNVKGGTDFVKTGADGAPSNKKVLITKGMAAGLYAEPDAQFHPGYTAANTPAWNLTAGFTWNWTVPAGVTKTTPGGAPANFVELKSSTAGGYDINVKEKSSSAFGGCEDATGKDFRLVVFDTPTIDFDASTGRALTAACGDITGHEVKLNISATDFITAKLRMEECPVTIDPSSGNKTVGTVRTTTQIATAKQAAGASATIAGFTCALDGTAFAFDTDEANRNLVLTLTRDYAVNTANNDVITLYRFVIDNTDAANLGGINDFVSRKSDHNTQTAAAPAAYTMYDNGTAKTLEVYVKRAPKTGPVYHINNNIAK